MAYFKLKYYKNINGQYLFKRDERGDWYYLVVGGNMKAWSWYVGPGEQKIIEIPESEVFMEML
jgi:hypothetical protein